MEDADFDRTLLERDEMERLSAAHLEQIAQELAAVKLKVDKDLSDQVSKLQAKMDQNTAITEQVRDILASFRIAGAVAKWIAAVVAGLFSLYHGMDWLRK